MRRLMREARWLTRERALAVCRLLFVALLGLFATTPWTIPAMGAAHDFGAFWTAARLALSGAAPDAYGEPARAAMTAQFGPARYAIFFYPPIALLLWIPFAALPFGAAAAAWIASSLVGYVAALRSLLGRGYIAHSVAFPALFFCVLYGQNSFFSAALLGGAASLLDRRPVVAGILLGALAYKPQLAVLVPVALAVARRWRALASAAGTVALLVGLSVIAFGVAAWTAFIGALPAAAAWNAQGTPGFDHFISAYASVRMLGGGETAAWVMQLAGSAIAVGGLAVAATTRIDGAALVAVMVVATGFCVPFFGDYDLVVFIVPGAWVAAEALRTGWLAYERIGLAALYLSPIAIKVAAAGYQVPLGPLALALLAMIVFRRAMLVPRVSQPPARNPALRTARDAC